VLGASRRGSSRPRLAPTVALMIDSAPIDYALFIVTRYRQSLHRGCRRARHDQAMGTAGRAVLFAGATVIISLLA